MCLSQFIGLTFSSQGKEPVWTVHHFPTSAPPNAALSRRTRKQTYVPTCFISWFCPYWGNIHLVFSVSKWSMTTSHLSVGNSSLDHRVADLELFVQQTHDTSKQKLVSNWIYRSPASQPHSIKLWVFFKTIIFLCSLFSIEIFFPSFRHCSYTELSTKVRELSSDVSRLDSCVNFLYSHKGETFRGLTHLSTLGLPTPPAATQFSSQPENVAPVNRSPPRPMSFSSSMAAPGWLGVWYLDILFTHLCPS